MLNIPSRSRESRITGRSSCMRVKTSSRRSRGIRAILMVRRSARMKSSLPFFSLTVTPVKLKAGP